MEKIIACVTENKFPLCVMFLKNMRYDLSLDNDGLFMVLKMKKLYGTTI
jgi:hypothetical protein